ncbi:MAG TPA: ribonuclease HII [Acidimicrobiales bacterium]|nr:ribonuclease HII [Acidimicrobiales bacterium]
MTDRSDEGGSGQAPKVRTKAETAKVRKKAETAKVTTTEAETAKVTSTKVRTAKVTTTKARTTRVTTANGRTKTKVTTTKARTTMGRTNQAKTTKGRTNQGRTTKGRNTKRTVSSRTVSMPTRPIIVEPDDSVEQSLRAEGCRFVAGLDEVGRGAWAGPVSVGVAVTPVGTPWPAGLRDSKLVPEEDRETLFPLVAEWCVDWSVGHAGHDECDRWGMTIALRVAAHRAVAGLSVTPDVLLLDGIFDYITHPEDGDVRQLEDTDLRGIEAQLVTVPPVKTILGGDGRCTAIAAASILAKVTRDRLMRDLSGNFPAFDFHHNKGYPTPVHRTALSGCGLTSIHRRSWAYVDTMPFR